MTPTPIVDITIAVFLCIIFVRRIMDRSIYKNNWQLAYCLMLIILLVIDALSMTLTGPAYPAGLRFVLSAISIFGAGLCIIGYTFYSETLLRETTGLKLRVFPILETVEVIWLIALIYEGFANRIITYPEGIINFDYSYPIYIDFIEFLILLSVPLIAIVLIKRIGAELAVLFGLFAVGPILATVLFSLTDIDLSYALPAFTFLLMDEFIQKNHVSKQYKMLQETQKEADEAKKLAESANKSKTEFLFNMSHDIRTPMNAIIGYTNMAAKHIDDSGKVLECLDKIGISGQQLLTLINQVLEMARIESGKLEFVETPINVRKEFNSMVTVLSEQVAANGQKFKYSLGNIEHNYLLADEAKVSSVTLNIAGNAMKYTPEGGSIEFGLEEIPTRKPGYATFVYTVADTGIGMSPEYLEELYEPFSREKTSTVSRIEGTGLGLSIVKNTIDLMGGNIEVQSEPGKGTRFDITLDFKIDENAGQTAEEKEELLPVDFKGRRALLVEDNEMNREIARDILEEQGIIVEDAEDGDIAVAMVKEAAGRGEFHYYDFILMDVQMPRMSGYEATKAIREIPGLEEVHIPIIAMTANAFEEDRRNALAAGMDEHLAKPVDVQKVFRTIAKFLK